MTASRRRADEGDTITLKATANTGYVFGSWIVKTEDDDPVTVTNSAFTMPAKNVTVSAKFNQEQSESNTTYTYTSDFLNTKFFKVKDVQWDTDNPVHSVSSPEYVYTANEGQTTSADWPAGTYIRLAKNDTTTTAGYYFGNSDTEKVIPTYTMTLFTTGQASRVIGTEVIILGFDKNGYGFMAENSGYGTFFYTQLGWTQSNNGTGPLSVDYTGKIYPTYEEVLSYIEALNEQ